MEESTTAQRMKEKCRKVMLCRGERTDEWHAWYNALRKEHGHKQKKNKNERGEEEE